MSGENDGRARRRNCNLLIGKYAMLFFGTSADVDIHAQIEAARPLQFIPDQQRNFAWRFAMNQNLGRCDDLRESDVRVGDRNSLQPLSRVDQQRLANHDAQRRRSLLRRAARAGRWSGFRLELQLGGAALCPTAAD